MRPPQRFFITGTDTGVGKTRIAIALTLAFAAGGKRVAGMKPVAAGCVATRAGLRSEDATALLEAMNVAASYTDVNPYAFEPAIAPHIAAEEAGRPIDFDILDLSFDRLCARCDVIIVEGAGGWLAPLDSQRTFADLAAHWHLDVVLVVGLRLGCLNHALLTAESIERHGLRLSGWIGNSAEPDFARREENIHALETRLAAPCLGTFAYSPPSSPSLLAHALRPRLNEMDPAVRP